MSPFCYGEVDDIIKSSIIEENVYEKSRMAGNNE